MKDKPYTSEKENISERSKSPLSEIIDKCAFLRHCRDNADKLPEPDWFCMIGSLCFEGGSRPLIHDLSKPYPNYTIKETEEKIRNAQDKQSGPILCKTIQEKTGFDCPSGGCGISSPVHFRLRIKKRSVEKRELSEERYDLENENWSNWPILDESALFGFAKKFVDVATVNSEADPAAILMTFLCGFCVECGPSPILMVGDSKHYPRIFAVIVGNSSKARKGTSGMPVKRLFAFQKYKHNDENFHNAVNPARTSPGPLSTGEGIIYAVRDPIESWKVDNKTKQGEYIITEPGINDKRLFVLDEEFASALSCTKREGNTLSTILRSMWDSGDLDPLTKTSKIKSTGAHIGICTHITIKELNKKLDETEAFNGFANRFLWCCAKRSKLVPFPEPIPEEKLMKLQVELKDIINAVHNIQSMTLSCEYKKMWGKVYPEISRDHDGLVGNVINRAEAQVIRLSMIYALLEAQNIIMPNHLNAALAMWNYCENSARFIFSDHEPDPYTNKIVEALQVEPKSTTELHNLFNRKLKGKKLNTILKELIAKGKIKSETTNTKGKPKTLFQLSN